MWGSYQVTMEPLDQTVSRGVRDLAAQTLPFLRVHQLQDAPQVFQKVKRPQAAHERRGGRLAVKQPVGVVQSLGAWGKEAQQIEETAVPSDKLWFWHILLWEHL